MVFEDPWWLITLKLSAVVFLVLLNGFFVAAEFALVKVRATQIATLTDVSETKRRLAEHMTTHLDAYLSATQLGITLASLGLGWIGEPAVATLIEPLLLAAGVDSPAVLHTTAFILAFSFITFLHIVFGELAPKSLAIQHAHPVTMNVARPLRFFYVLFRPAITVLNGAANAFLRGIGVPPAGSVGRVHSAEEVRLILAESGREQALPAARANVLLNVLELGELTVRQIMTPRPRMITIDLRLGFDEAVRVAEANGYSRYPVVDGDVDHVVAMVHLRDLITTARGLGPAPDLRKIMRDIHVVPDSVSVETLLQDMLARGRHMAIVIDEHGGTEGLVTLEDIFEELFGEIRDEFDEATQDLLYVRLGPTHFLLDGALPLHEAEEVLDIPLESEEVTTVGGYVVERLGHLPTRGERFELGSYHAVVRDADRKRVRTVEVWRSVRGNGGEGR